MYIAGNHEWHRYEITPASHGRAKVDFQEFMNGRWVGFGQQSIEYYLAADIPEEYDITPEETAEYNKMMGIA